MTAPPKHITLDESYAYLGWIVLIVFSGGALFPLIRVMLYQDSYLGQLIFASLAIGMFMIASKSILELGRRRYRIHLSLGEHLEIRSMLGEQPLQSMQLAYDQIKTVRILPASERKSTEAWFDFSFGYICILELQNGETLDLPIGAAKQLQFRIDELQRIAEAIQQRNPSIQIISPMNRVDEMIGRYSSRD
jgi:hypothetical protein